MVLQIESVSHTYRDGRQGEVVALQEVSLLVATGEVVAVVGPSGCGKTTLLHIAGGLRTPSAGRVRVDGNDLSALSHEERSRVRASMIGCVFQSFHLIPYLPVIDNVLAPSIAVQIKAPKQRAIDLLRRFDLNDRLTHLPGQLSTGEQQRVALSRALLHQPKLVLADEPTGNLDPENRKTVLSHLSATAREGAAVLIVTHDVLAAQSADRVVELSKVSEKKLTSD